MYRQGTAQRWRRYARGGVGMRGLGQACLEYDDSGNCVETAGGAPGATVPLPPLPCSDPGADIANCTGTVGLLLGEAPSPSGLYPVVAGPTLPAGAPVSVGSSAGCAAGYVVSDASGNCAPAATVLANLSTPAGAAAAGLSASQAAAITAALRTATGVVAAISPPPVVAPPVSTNPFASISTTTWIVIAAAGAAVLLLSSRKGRR
jgi:hypothetical protein